MKIIFSSYDDINNPYYSGGGARAVHEIAKRLARQNRVSVYTGSYIGAENRVVDGVAYRRIGVNLAGPKFGQLIFNILLPYYVLKGDFDLWIENFTPPFSTAFLPLFTKKPVVGLVHMLASEDMERKYKLPFRLIENLGLKTYKYFIVVGDYFKKKVLKMNKSARVLVVTNGVEIPKKKLVGKKSHILFLGRIEVDQKGIDLLIKAYRRISKRNIPKLIIAGSGIEWEEKKLLKIIKESGLESKIYYVGRVTGKEKSRLFDESFLVVIPSRFETFSIVSLEALSFRAPVVCFDIAGLKWLTPKNSIKVKPFNTNYLGKAILNLVTNENLRSKLAEAGYEYARAHTWGKVSKEYKNFLFKVVGK
jgi:glycosyltransferase involved in cell wall biosynthesis